MTASSRNSSVSTPSKSKGHALLTAALLSSEIISGGHAFSTPVAHSSLQKIRNGADLEGRSSAIQNKDKHVRKALFANQYYNEDQWEDDAGYEYEEQVDSNEISFQQFDPRNYEGAKRAILGGAALGTMMAINNAVGMSAGAETTVPGVPTGEVTQQSVDSSVESFSAVTYATPEASLPYLEKQIQEAEQALADSVEPYESSASVISSAESVSETSATFASAAPVSQSTSETTAAFAPSFIRYTQEHIPGWIETGHKVYDAAAPKIVAGGQKLSAEFDKKVMPTVIEKEHQLLGDDNSAILDQTLSTAASAGKMMAGMLGKVITFGVKGGIEVAKATPGAIHAVQDMYKTLDEKIVPEVVETSRKMQMIVDKTVPEVMDTGKHAYDTIMPEFVSAERQVAGVVRSGVEAAMPTVREIESKVMPELNKMERNVLGEEQAAMLDKTVAEVAQQGEDFYRSAEKTIPQVLATGQKTVDTVAYTGQAVARAVPLIIESGKQTVDSVDRGVQDAISTTQDIISDIGTSNMFCFVLSF